MGLSHSRKVEPPKLKNSELQEFSRQSLFSAPVVEKLYSHFYRIASSQNDDGVIDLNEFCTIVCHIPSQSRILKGLFNLFDANSDGAINFREFIQGLSIFNKVDYLGNNIDSSPMIAAAKTKEQVGYCLRVIDIDKKKKICLKDVQGLLMSTAKLNIGLKISEKNIEEIVKRTFDEEDWRQEGGEVFLTVENYTSMAMKRPEQFDWLMPDMERIMQDQKKPKHKNSKSRCLSV